MNVGDFLEFLKLSPIHARLSFFCADLKGYIMRIPVCRCEYIEDKNIVVLYDYQGLSGRGISCDDVELILYDVPKDAIVVTGEEDIRDDKDNIVIVPVPGVHYHTYIFDQRLIDGSDAMTECLHRLRQDKPDTYDAFKKMCEEKNIELKGE